MMNWLYYLLEANLYLAVFHGFYRLFLHRETFYTLNRYYLLLAALVSFILPFLQIGYLNQLLTYHDPSVIKITKNVSVTNNKYNNAAILTVNNLVFTAYMMAAVFFTIRLIKSIYNILSLSFKAKKQRIGKIIHVECSSPDAAFSFFNLLFINPSITEKDTILKHEMVHIHQKHSLDVFFFEIIQITSWFNPAIYFIRKDIKLLHEYIADDLTTDQYIHKHEYAIFLIHNSFGIIPNQLTNQIFNQSILKKRIKMLNKEKSAGRARLRLLLALPIAGGMLCASTMAFTRDYAMIDLYPEKYKSEKSVVQQDTILERRSNKQKKAKKMPAGKTKSIKLDQVKISPPPPPKEKRSVKLPPPPPKERPTNSPPPPPRQQTKEYLTNPTKAIEQQKSNNNVLYLNLKEDGLLKNGTVYIEFRLKGDIAYTNGKELPKEISQKYKYMLNLKEHEAFAIDVASPSPGQ